MTSPYLTTPLRSLAEYDAEQEQSMTGLHTPGPYHAEHWDYSKANPPRTDIVIQTNRDAIARISVLWRGGDDPTDEMEANAAFIVTACNSHAELVEALTALVDEKVDYMLVNNLGFPEHQHTIKQARAALAAAK